MAQACSGLYDAATDSMSLRHRGQAPIATALAGARQKNLSEGAWTWNRKSVTGSDVDWRTQIFNVGF